MIQQHSPARLGRPLLSQVQNPKTAQKYSLPVKYANIYKKNKNTI